MVTYKFSHLPNWMPFKSNLTKRNIVIYQKCFLTSQVKRKMHFLVMFFVVINHLRQKQVHRLLFFLCIYILLITLNIHKHWWIIVKYIYWVATKRVKIPTFYTDWLQTSIMPHKNNWKYFYAINMFVPYVVKPLIAFVTSKH